LFKILSSVALRAGPGAMLNNLAAAATNAMPGTTFLSDAITKNNPIIYTLSI